METSILNSTKKILGIDAFYNAFDLDVITHINSAFAVLNSLGVGPNNAFYITDDSDQWSDLGMSNNSLNLVRTYIFLKVRYLFDPPTTSFLLEAVNKQIQEHEWRLMTIREYEDSLTP